MAENPPRPPLVPVPLTAAQLYAQAAQAALQQVLKTTRMTTHRGRHATAAGTKAPELQQLLDTDLFCLHADRRTKLSPVQQLSLLHLLAQFFLEKNDDTNKYAYFEAIFLGREGEPMVHDFRIYIMMQLSSFSLQFPVVQFLNLVSQWLNKMTNPKQAKVYTDMIVEILMDHYIQTSNEENRMYEYLYPLEMYCTEFTATFVAIAPLHASMANNTFAFLIASFLNKNVRYIIRHLRDTPYLGDEFASKTMPIFLKYGLEQGEKCSNSYHMNNFCSSLAVVLQTWTQKFLAGRTPAAKQLIDHEYLFSKLVPWSIRRCELINAVLLSDGNRKYIMAKFRQLQVPSDYEGVLVNRQSPNNV